MAGLVGPQATRSSTSASRVVRRSRSASLVRSAADTSTSLQGDPSREGSQRAQSDAFSKVDRFRSEGVGRRFCAVPTPLAAGEGSARSRSTSTRYSLKLNLSYAEDVSERMKAALLFLADPDSVPPA